VQQLQQQVAGTSDVLQLMSTNMGNIPSSSSSEERGHAAPKPTKPEVFDPSKGGVNVRTWLFSLNNYFDALGTPREDFATRKNYAVTLLHGPIGVVEANGSS